MNTGLGGRVVLITGAASGIGLASAKAFASEGARLALVDIQEGALAALARELGSGVEVSTAVADLSTAEGVEQGIARALAAYSGAVDVLYNNVGAGVPRTLDELDDDAWHQTFELNFMSQVRALRVVLPTMRAAGRGVVVNSASDVGRQPITDGPDYCASKAAVLSLTKSVALAEAPTIRVNAVAPGPVWTPMWSAPGGIAEALGAARGLEPKVAADEEIASRGLPLARLGVAEEIANVVVFLASDLTSYVTNSVWGVDGGSIRTIA